MSDTVFRERIDDISETEVVPEKPAEVTGIVDDPSKLDIYSGPGNNLENWELENGKYGLEYLGIKEIGKTFPLNAQFGELDKYIKQEISNRGYDNTTNKWQEVLKELENEAGSEKMGIYERLKRLVNLIRIIKKQKTLKEKRELYQIIR